MSKSILLPKEIHNRLTEEYKRILSEAPGNPWMTFSEFIVAVVRLGEKRFTEMAETNPSGLAELLAFFNKEAV